MINLIGTIENSQIIYDVSVMTSEGHDSIPGANIKTDDGRNKNIS